MKVFPEAFLVYFPEGTKHLVAQACDRYRLTFSDYLREAMAHRLQADGLPVPPVLEQRRAHLPATSNYGGQ